MGKESCGSLAEDLVDVQSHIIDTLGDIDTMYVSKVLKSFRSGGVAGAVL